MRNTTLIERIATGLTMEEVIEGAAKENQIHLKNMNGFEEHFFKIGFYEGLRLAEKIIEEVKEECRR